MSGGQIGEFTSYRVKEDSLLALELRFSHSGVGDDHLDSSDGEHVRLTILDSAVHAFHSISGWIRISDFDTSIEGRITGSFGAVLVHSMTRRDTIRIDTSTFGGFKFKVR